MAVLQELSIDLDMGDEFIDQFDLDELGLSVIRRVTDARTQTTSSPPRAPP